MDVFSSQKTEEVKKVFKEVNCTTSFIPSGCTGFVQPLDVAVNKPLKNCIKELLEIHYDGHMDKWKEGSYSVGDRRIMITKWVGQAWREFHAEQSHVIVKTFRKVSLSLTIDGSKDHELHVKDIQDIQVGDWTLEKEIPLDEIDDQGGHIVPNSAVVSEDTKENVEETFCMADEEEAINEELDAEGEEDEE